VAIWFVLESGLALTGGRIPGLLGATGWQSVTWLWEPLYKVSPHDPLAFPGRHSWVVRNIAAMAECLFLPAWRRHAVPSSPRVRECSPHSADGVIMISENSPQTKSNRRIVFFARWEGRPLEGFTVVGLRGGGEAVRSQCG